MKKRLRFAAGVVAVAVTFSAVPISVSAASASKVDGSSAAADDEAAFTKALLTIKSRVDIPAIFDGVRHENSLDGVATSYSVTWYNTANEDQYIQVSIRGSVITGYQSSLAYSD